MKRLAADDTLAAAAKRPAATAGPSEAAAAAAEPGPEPKLYTLRLVRAKTQSYVQYKTAAHEWRLLVSVTAKQCVHHLALLRRLMARVIPGQDSWMSCTWTCALPFQSVEEIKAEFTSRKALWLQRIWEQEQTGQRLDQTDLWPPPYPVVRRWPPPAT